ncbi:MAG: sugar transferase [Litoreibacter sp.]|uniref:sugar transferase n=1 Tax=Litoreibacter sp. TaxID=1969459 RepID=UPI003299E2DC
MTLSKRLFDLAVLVFLTILLAPVMVVTAIAIAIIDGRPVFYFAERMKTPAHAFHLVKFRTMKTVLKDQGVSGGNKSDRVTRLGAFLRRARLDETPQLWNLARGDISLVGPRPPLREYVERFPETYSKVLKSRPGITGLASSVFHAHETMLIKNCETPEQTDKVYAERCVPRKAKLDLIYQRNRSLCFDLWIVLKTFV